VLFVPGDRSDRFEKAARSGADAVVCDLEDAVGPDTKADARIEVAQWLAGTGTATVRINAVGSPWYEQDCAALIGLPGLRAVMVPKAEDPKCLAALAVDLGGIIPIVALIETALGVHRAYEIAATSGVVRLAFGPIDFALDVETSLDDLALLYARSTLVVASRSARISPPIDGATADLDNLAAAGIAAATARRLGFGGKLCIHPGQVDYVTAAFTPSKEEVANARRIVANAAGGATRLDSQMIDRPVLERARRVLAHAERFPQTVSHLPEGS